MTTRLGAGVWVDDEGHMHFSVPELLEHFGWPHDAEHQAMVRSVIREELERRHGPGVQVIERDACPHCGLHGLGLHAEGCPYRGGIH